MTVTVTVTEPIMPSSPRRPATVLSEIGHVADQVYLNARAVAPSVTCLRISNGPALELADGARCPADHPRSSSTVVPPEAIRAIIAKNPTRHRFTLSKVVCERLH